MPDAKGLFRCPLCLKGFTLEAVDEDLLSVEHVIPSSLGGRVKTLTCKACNSRHGSTLDSHVVRAMDALDGLSGNGVIRGIFHSAVGHVAVNFDIRTGEKNDPNVIRVVGKASNWAAIEEMHQTIPAGGPQKYTLNFDFVPLQYWRGLLRIAYLTAFHRLGYQYAMTDFAAEVRRVLEAGEVPALAILSAHPIGELQSPLIYVDNVSADDLFLIVVFGLRSAVSRYFAVFLPAAIGCSWQRVTDRATFLRGASLKTLPRGSQSEVVIRFGVEPVTQFRASGGQGLG